MGGFLVFCAACLVGIIAIATSKSRRENSQNRKHAAVRNKYNRLCQKFGLHSTVRKTPSSRFVSNITGCYKKVNLTIIADFQEYAAGVDEFGPNDPSAYFHGIILHYPVPPHFHFTIYTGRSRKNDLKSLDNQFDSRFNLQSNSPLRLTALLNRDLRNSICDTKKLGILKINRERVCLSKIPDSADLFDIVEQLVKIVLLISGPKNTSRGLIEIFRTDPVENVRERALQLLAEHYAAEKEVAGIIGKALGSPVPGIRFTALRYLPPGDNRFAECLGGLWEISPAKLKCEIIAFLQSNPGFSVESFLIARLPREEFNVQKRIIEALEFCGTLASVEVLYNQKNLLLRPSARKAIILIQEREKPSGGMGQLSLTTSVANQGNLGLTAPPHRGSVSLREPLTTSDR